uniref:Potassium channel domain-containing protein n=1 Tax=Meloidogyne floridensis TaxID=298350 RepID=A0A915NPI0_9BILA
MCGIAPNELCKWSEALPGQFGFTKQLVFRVALPHITLLCLSIFYVVIGSFILITLNENNSENEIFEIKRQFVDETLKKLVEILPYKNNNNSKQDEIIKIFFGYFYEENKDPFKKFILNVYEINERNKYSNSIIWNLFFSTTWLTSIGYGVNAPSSLGQRIFCIFYLIFGIPLYLVTLADLAKFCTEGINRLYTECVKFRYYLLGWYRHRKRRIHANSGIEYIAVGTRGRRRLSSRKLSGQLVRNEEEMAEFLWKNLEKTHFVEVPFFLVYILLLAYIIGSAQFVAYLEDWAFFDSLYFIMMSVMTIGFGDLVPKNIKFILPILFIILIGLIVATTFIDMVGAYYIDRLHFFGRRMDLEVLNLEKEYLGKLIIFYDPLEWLKAVQQRRIEAMKREAMRKLFETATAMYRLNAGSF